MRLSTVEAIVFVWIPGDGEAPCHAQPAQVVCECPCHLALRGAEGLACGLFHKRTTVPFSSKDTSSISASMR